MNLKQIQEDIAKGEGLHREFKEAGSQLPRNLFETVCAFLNTDGGTILLGVADDGTVTGVNPDAVERMKSDLANLSNKYLPFYAKGAKPLFNETRHGFELTIPLADEVAGEEGTKWAPSRHQLTGEVTGEVAGEVTGEVIDFLKVLGAAPLGRKEAQSSLGLKGQANFRERYLEPAISNGLVEMTQPDSPKSPTQKYRLTAKGKQLLEGGK